MQAAPDGYAWVPFGGSGDDKGTVIIAGDGLDPIVVPDVVIPYPTTKKALEAYATGRSTTVLDVDGNEITFTGVYALAANKIPHDYETVRGAYRAEAKRIIQRGGDPSKAINVDAVRGEFRTIYKPGRKVATQVIPEEELADLSPAEIIEVLKTKGLVS